jgi:hypothetical protein
MRHAGGPRQGGGDSQTPQEALDEGGLPSDPSELEAGARGALIGN